MGQYLQFLPPNSHLLILSSWRGPSKLQGNLLEGRPPGNSWQPRLLGSLLPQQGASRSLTATGLAQLLSGRSEGGRLYFSCGGTCCQVSIVRFRQKGPRGSNG